MYAIAKVKADKGLDIIEKDIVNDLGDNEILVEIDAVSICGTDLHIYDWDSWAQSRIKLPLTLGHEGTGKIIKKGKNVKLSIGQRVSFESHIPCFDCYQCKNRNFHICSNLKLLGVDVDGLFRKYAILPEFIAIPNYFDSEEAAIFEPLGNAFHCLQRVDIRGKYVGILGDGPIALFLFYYAQKFGPNKIFLVGANNYRINHAKRLNYQDHIILDFFNDDIYKKVYDYTNGRMLDIIFEMAGSEKTVSLAIELLTMGGKLVAFGILPNKIYFDYNSLIFKAIDIISINGRMIFDSWIFMKDIVKKGELKNFITHIIDFKDFKQAFELLLNKQALKIVLRIN